MARFAHQRTLCQEPITAPSAAFPAVSRRAALRLLSFSGVALLAACAPPTAPPTATPAPAASPTAAPVPTPAPTAARASPAAPGAPAASLRLMGWSSSPEEDRLLNELLQDFTAQHPGIQVRFEPVLEYEARLRTELAAGTAADVFYVDSVLAPDLMKPGQLLELDGHLQRDGVDLDDFYPGLLAAFQWRGRTYGLPKDWSSLAMEWNQEMAGAAGLSGPPTSWDELRSAARRLTDRSKQQFGAIIVPDLRRYGAFVFQAGGRLVSEDGTRVALNSPEGLAALEFYSGLYRDGYASTPAETGTQWPGDAFARRRGAIVFEGNWIFPFLQKNAPDLKYGIAELPAGPRGRGTFAFTVSYSVNAKTSQKDAAWLLVSYLTGVEGMRRWTSLGLAMPSRRSLEPEWTGRFKEREPFLKAGAYAQAWQMGPGGQEINDRVANPALADVFAGRKSPKDALAEIESKGNAILARAGG